MNKIEKWIDNLNQQQKMIFAIALPIALGLIVMPIASENSFVSKSGGRYVSGNAFRFENTWWIWLVYL